MKDLSKVSWDGLMTALAECGMSEASIGEIDGEIVIYTGKAVRKDINGNEYLGRIDEPIATTLVASTFEQVAYDTCCECGHIHDTEIVLYDDLGTDNVATSGRYLDSKEPM